MTTEEILTGKIKSAEESIGWYNDKIEQKAQELSETVNKRNAAQIIKAEYEQDLKIILAARSMQEAPRARIEQREERKQCK